MPKLPGYLRRRKGAGRTYGRGAPSKWEALAVLWLQRFFSTIVVKYVPMIFNRYEVIAPFFHQIKILERLYNFAVSMGIRTNIFNPITPLCSDRQVGTAARKSEVKNVVKRVHRQGHVGPERGQRRSKLDQLVPRETRDIGITASNPETF